MQSAERVRQSILAHCERCKPWIEDALQYAETHSYDDIVRGIMTGHMQLWPAENGCLVTEIIHHPKKQVLNVFLGGGKMGDLLGMYEPIEAWAKAQGCQSMTIHGRKGWEKVFAKRGWKFQQISLEKEID